MSIPKRISYAGSETDNITIDYKKKYGQQQQVIKDSYATFEVPYNGKDNNNYTDGSGFCCDDKPQTRSLTPGQNDNYELAQFYYHPDHLGSSSFITNLDGDVTQHIEYVPFGEVFVEERNNVWNTPYLFNAKELDEETGLYYYGARYYNPRTSIWISADPLAEKRIWSSSYNYCQNSPVLRIDPSGALDDNYTIYYDDRNIHKEKTDDPTNTYTYIDIDGNVKDLGTYNVATNSRGEEMVEAGQGVNGSNQLFKWKNITSGNMYFEEDAFAALLGGIQKFYDDSFQIPLRIPENVQINQFMSSERIHSHKGNRQSALDVAFYRNNGTTGAWATEPNISTNLNVTLLNSLKFYGLGSTAVFTSTSQYSSTALFSGTKGLPNHHHHFHFDGFNGSVIPVLPTFTVTNKIFNWSNPNKFKYSLSK